MLNLCKLPPFTFPKGFLWGSATAGHQIEGDNVHSQWFHEEQTCTEPGFERSGKACNSWELYDEDIRLLKELGHQAYRFSVEWSRIEPEQGRHDQGALDRYLDMLRKLKEAGIFTCVTLLHGTHPQWFEELGGFCREENVDHFLRHVEFLVPKIAAYVDSWLVVNEINLGGILPEHIQLRRIRFKALARGAEVVKRFSSAPVSSAHAFVPREPLRPDDELDVAAARYKDWLDNGFFFHGVRTGELVLPGQDAEFLPELKNACDFWAVNYYHRGLVDSRKGNLIGKKFRFNAFNTVLGKAMDREFCPETFVKVLGRITDKPIWITENGFCADEDRFRIVYLMQHLAAMHEAMELYHADVRAYFHWSLLDNYEWGSYAPKFGLAAVDRQTFRRTPKPSAAFYREVIRANGASGELFAKYIPELSQYAQRDHFEAAGKLSVLTQA